MKKFFINNEMKNTYFLGAICFLAYSACYTGRSILSAIMPDMIRSGKFSKETLGLMGGSFFFSYGVGQIINGIIGDRIKAKYMISIGLLSASVTIVYFPAVKNENTSVILWGICGFMLSMLWGPLSKVIAENTSPNLGRIFLTLLNVATILGTMAAYLIATLSSVIEKWAYSFYITGAFLLITALFWYMCLDYLEKKNALKKIDSGINFENGYKELIRTLLDNNFIPMIFVTIINGIIRNAVAFWIPTYISEKLGASPAAAAGISSVLPIVNLIGTFTGLYIYSKVKKNEYMVSIILFAVATAMFFVMWIIDGRFFIMTIFVLFIASAAMTSVCNMIFGVYCIKFRETGRVSAISGFLNFTSYASASVASMIFINLVSKVGWNFTVLIWAYMSMFGGVFAYLAYKEKVYIFK